MILSLLLFPMLGMDFFPQVDAGQMRLHVRAPPGTRLEKTQEDFARVESAIRQIVGNNQIDVVLNNIQASIQRHQHRPERLGNGRPDGRRDSDLTGQGPYANSRSHRRPAARIAAAVSANAVFLSAGRHRESGAEFRPAGARSTFAFRAPTIRPPTPSPPSWPKILVMFPASLIPTFFRFPMLLLWGSMSIARWLSRLA